MATKNWDGSDGAFTAAGSWSPAGVPGAGDIAAILSGTVTATGLLPGSLTVQVKASQNNSPVLRLTSATLPAASVLSLQGAGSAAVAQVRGAVVNQGTIQVSSTSPGSAAFLLFDQAGGGATTLTNNGTIAIADGTAQFYNFGSNAGNGIVNNGTLSFSTTGGANSSFIAAPLSGAGQVVIGSGYALEMQGAVSSGQIIDFASGPFGTGTLQLDDPVSFKATLLGFVSSDQLLLGQVQAPGLIYTSTSATSGFLTVTTSGTAFSTISLRGVYKASDFALSSAANGSSVLTTTATTPVVNYTDTATSTSGTATPDLYNGPVNYLQYQYIWNSADGVAMSTAQDNVFLHGGSGNDAIVAHGGSNVIDGGGGSNFLIGATGADGGSDTFFVDGRGGTVTWSSIQNFHHGDAVTVFGFTGGVSTLPLTANDGAAGFTGATIHSELSGAGSGVNGSVTFIGVSLADAQDVSNGGKFTYQFGNLGGTTPYMSITYTG